MPVTATAPARGVQYDWPRFWIEHTGILDLSDAGFLRDPVEHGYTGDPLKPLAALDHIPALALLGEPGIGKSTALKIEHERLRALPPEEKITSLHVDLRGTLSEDRLYDRIFEAPEVVAWQASDSHLYLLLDSLDEAMLRIETISYRLAEGFRTLPADRLSVRVTCRTAVWPAATLGTALQEIWGEAGFGTFELAPLRRCDLQIALAANGIDPDVFIRRLFGAHAVSFSIKPLTLKMLLKLYQRDGSLPTSTADLYRQGCLGLCEEQNDGRRETGRRGNLNAKQRLRLAGRIAAATVLGGRFAVWTGPETDAPVEEALVSALAGAREEGDFAAFTASDDDVREVLDTGLFNSRGVGRMGWAHHTYAEFLAALYLAEKNVRKPSILQILTHPGGGLIPQLVSVAAWGASLIPTARATLITSDPWALLRGDLSSWSPEDLEALVASMLRYVDEGKYYERFFGMFETYVKLNHPNLAAQLRQIITNPSLLPITRRTALSIAERCALADLQPELLQLANDSLADPWLRAGSIAALKHCGDASVPPQILALIRTGITPDPDDEIRGSALDLLWPSHISSQELFSFLGPANERHYGSYHQLLRELPKTLPASDLPVALGWATTYLSRASLTNEFYEKTLADAVIFRAWEFLDDQSVLDALLAHLEVRLQRHGECFRGTDFSAQEAFKNILRGDESGRRRFFLSLCRQPRDRLAAYTYVRNGFVRRDDLDWLLEISLGGISPVPGLNEDSLCNFIRLLFETDDNEQFELVYPVAQRWPALRAELSFLLQGIPFDSDGARQARELFHQERAIEAQRPPPAIPDLPSAISDFLALAENGDWSAWWRLTIVLNLKPEMPVAIDGLNYFITSMPGWVAADEVIRERIVTAARRYLAEAESSADDWVGQNPTPMRSNDIAALRAYILLYEAARDRYRQIPVDIWVKWTPVIVALPRMGSDKRSEELDAILHDALNIAPAEFIATVTKMLHMEMWRARIPETPQQSAGSPFFILRELAGCWADERLKTALFEEMQEPGLTPAEYCAILEPLVEAGYEPAIEHAVSRLNNLDESTLTIAEVLLRPSTAAVWPILWPKLGENDALARGFFLLIARGTFGQASFYAALGADAIADLYLLVERLFPPASDPPPPSGFVSPRQMVTHLRDGIPEYLVNLASEDAIRALRRLAAGPPARPHMFFALSRAEVNMRMKTWAPLSTNEILAVADRPNVRLVTSAHDLLDILLETMSKFASELHGVQTPVRDLWDRMPGRPVLYRPIEEDGFSNVVARYLRHELETTGIFANREVEVRRRPGDPVGQRTDILVNTNRRGPDGRPLEPIAAVIEVKCCWNPEVFTGLRAQLVQDYMVNLSAPVGIFLVGWFDITDWDQADNRRRQTPRRPISDVQNRLDQQAAAAPEGFQVRAMVMDIRSPGT